MTLTRTALGNRLLQWHSSQGDPIYAVGSFYIDGTVYPVAEVVEDAMRNITSDLRKFRKMVRGVPVMVERNGKQVSLKEFAGYKYREMRENIRDLREIAEGLDYFLATDYPSGEEHKRIAERGLDYDPTGGCE